MVWDAQILLCTTVFGGFELPVGNALGSNILEDFLGGSPGLVEIRSVDEVSVCVHELNQGGEV